MDRATPPLSKRVLRQIIRGIDWCLRRRIGIVEFETGSDALLRIGAGRAEHDVVLSDGTRFRSGDPVLELHFWNEHLPTLPPAGAPLRWAAATRHQVARSLQRLALHLQAERDLRDAKALLIKPAFASRSFGRNLNWIVARHGFESAAEFREPAPVAGAHRWLDSLWVWLLTWTFNPRSLRGRRFQRTRQEFWISRARFIALY
ncbi:MAG: YkoP family protein, partial [Stellaceae bacterium]